MYFTTVAVKLDSKYGFSLPQRVVLEGVNLRACSQIPMFGLPVATGRPQWARDLAGMIYEWSVFCTYLPIYE